MKLIKNWRKSWRMFSMQAMVLATALQGAWLAIPSDMKSTFPQGAIQWICIALMVLGVFGRLVFQPKVEK